MTAPIAYAATFLALALSTGVSLAATLGSGLERRLSSLSVTDSVSIIVGLADQADLSPFHGNRAEGAAVIGRLQDHAGKAQVGVVSFLESRGYAGRYRSFWINNSIAVRVPVGMLAELASLTAIERIDYDEPAGFGDVQIGNVVAAVNWNLAMVRADQAWATHGVDGTGIVIGSLDTGVDLAHPALAGKWRGGTNSWADMVQGLSTPYDDHGHGTHTIGTMVGGDGPGPFANDIGIAYNARFIAVKVLDRFNFSSGSSLLGGAQWMLDPDNNPATDDFPHVINNSWLFFDQQYVGFRPAVAAWRAAGIIPVFCAANNGPDAATTRPPGSYDNTIGVGATDSGDQIASFSSRGPSPLGAGFPPDQRKPDISAPGAAVVSCVPGGSYGAWSGTSMAAPHVAGAVALMLQVHPGMSVDQVRSALLVTSVDRGLPGYDHDFGYGRLDVLGAVTEALIPGVHLVAGIEDRDVQLDWNPSSRPDILRYDIYRSTEPDDFTPQLLGSTTATLFLDPHRFGRAYYRVLEVRSSGPSTYTNEVAISVCEVAAPDCHVVGASTVSPVFADFNSDGLLDVALANTVQSGTVQVALQTGAGQLGPITAFPAGVRPNGIAVGDFDSDGIGDLAVTNNDLAGTVSILFGNGAGGQGDGTFGAPVAYPANQKPVGIVCGDFDQDGIEDLAVAGNGQGNVAILLGGGLGGIGDGSFLPPVVYTSGNQTTAIVTGDFNDDGVLDLAATNNGNGRVGILIGNRTGGKGDGTFAATVTYTCGANPFGVVTDDFDGDGITDLAVARNANPGFVSILRGQGAGGSGNGTFAAAVQHPAGALPQGIAAADLNGDGITDLCVANSGGGVTALLGTGVGSVGNGGFEDPIAFPGGSSSVDLAIADFDGNGSPDFAVTSVSALDNLCVVAGSCGGDVPTISVVSPNGGESWPASTQQAIAWTKEPQVVSVNIDVSRDHGATWETIATHQTGTTFPWWVGNPSTATGAARIRVYDPRVSSADLSDAGFTIGPDIRTGVPGTPEGTGLALALENPASERLRVRFRLGTHPAATLEVLDVSGRRVLARAVGYLGAGAHTLDLGERLRAGIYLVRLTQGGERITRKAAVVR